MVYITKIRNHITQICIQITPIGNHITQLGNQIKNHIFKKKTYILLKSGINHGIYYPKSELILPKSAIISL